MKLHTKNWWSQTNKKKIEDSKTSKYQNKKPSKFTRRKINTLTPPYEASHTKNKNPQNDKKKIENSKFFFSLANGPSSCEKENFTTRPLKVKCFFTTLGDQFKWFFFTPNGGSLQVTFFSPPMGGHFKWFFFVFHFNGGSLQRIFHSQGFYFFTFLVHRFWLFSLFNY